ncbi:MAG: VanZ family protein [Lachnospiraceae bacterium]|nr:VanZ family protein [Lachnospiraceae bacterium]
MNNNDLSKNKENFVKVLFLLYLFALIRLIIFKYPAEYFREIAAGWTKEVIFEGFDSANFTLFKTIDMYVRRFDNPYSKLNLFGNLFAFIPFGFTMPIIHRRSNNLFVMLAHALVFIAGIEIFQLLTGFGAFDVDDILLNGLSAVIGWTIYIVYKRFNGG